MWGAVALLPLLLIFAFGPGLFVVRRFRWSPLETLAASVGLSLILVFLGAFISFWLNAPAWSDVVLSIVWAGLTITVWPDARALWRHTIVRRTAFSLLLLAAWTFVLLSLIRQYGGGDSCCDWLEHYQRAGHFLLPLPDDFLFLGRYGFEVRPPLMNVVTARLMWWTGADFVHYQLVSSALNIMGLLACCALSSLLSRTGRPADPRLIAVALAANPMFFVNTTFPWTKVLTAFFVLLAVSFYIRGIKRSDTTRVSAAVVALAAAVLTHYSAVVCALVIGTHYAFTIIRGRARWPAAIPGAVVAALLIAPWLGFVASTYGVGGLARNSTVEGLEEQSVASHIRTRALNMRDTFVPRSYDGYNGYPEDATYGRWLSDHIFTIYQGNAVLSVGAISGLIALALGVSAVRRVKWGPERWFWISFVPAVWLIGTWVSGDRFDNGVAMTSLQPATYLLVTFVVSRLRDLPEWAKRVWCAGIALDLVLGIASSVWFQMARGAWAFTPNWDIKAREEFLFLADVVNAPAVSIALLLTAAVLGAGFVSRQLRVDGA